MYLHIKRVILLAISVSLISSGCENYLDEKPSKHQVVPASLKDAQALLDNAKIFQGDLGSGEVSSDDYYLQDSKYLTLPEHFRNMYTWNDEFLFAPSYNDWRTLYDLVYVANTVLETLAKVDRNSSNAEEWDNANGQALYFRAHFYLQGAFIWCLAYDDASSSTDLGLPLRLNTNFNEKSFRSSVKQTYEQVIEDLEKAISLLPDRQISVTRPSKQAAYGLLARTYLAMRNYNLAGKYADLCLAIDDELLDFNSLTPSDTYPIKQLNKEVLFESRMSVPQPLLNTLALINEDLYNSYLEDDLRKSVFFSRNIDGTQAFKGSYEGGIIPFSGISKNEIYLIRAEAYARENKLQEAMDNLNDLLVRRWKRDSGTQQTLYEDQLVSDQKSIIDNILQERRKELLMRGLRWMDIKRLNKEGYNISLTRTVNGKTYNLIANDKRFAIPIPEEIIALSGMPQN